MRYGSICSGIEAATVAWHPLGWKPAFFSEIEAFPRAVLQYRYPQVPLHGDFTTIMEHDYDPIDLLVGGTPCQSFSVAGLRKGLADERGNLTLEFVRLAQRLRPRWLVWENVPGVLSIDRGRAFGSFLGGLAECGYGFAYRVLDAQYFGVPQRRRRVFVVGYLGDWRPPAAVLFERDCLLRDITPCRQARASVAALTANGVGTCGADDNQGQAGHLIPCDWPSSVAGTLDAHYGDKMELEDQHIFGQRASRFVAHTLTSRYDNSSNGTEGGTPIVPVAFSAKDYGADAAADIAPTLRSQSSVSGNQNSSWSAAVATYGIPGNWIGRAPENGGNATEPMANTAPCLTKTDQHGVSCGMQVRRLTPRECERLQGFPDDYTAIPKAADGPRYKALGNSMAVPVMRWIGERIESVNTMLAV